MKRSSMSGVEQARELVGAMRERIREGGEEGALLRDLTGYCDGALAALDTAQAEPRDTEPCSPQTDAPDGDDSQLRFLVSATRMFLYIAPPDTTYSVSYVSEGIRDMLGYEPWQCISAPGFLLEKVHPEDALLLPRNFAMLFEHGVRHIEYRVRHAAGGYRWISSEARLIRDADGQPTMILGCVVDITERKENELALRTSEQRFASFMRHLPGVSFIKDSDGRLIYVSDSVQRLGKGEPADIVGKTEAEMFGEEVSARLRRRDREVLETGQPLSVIERIDGHAGVEYWLVNRFPLPDPKTGGFVLGGIAIDVTHLQWAREELKANAERIKRLLSHLEKVREEQSAAIAREIHDELGSTLTAIKLGLALLPQLREDPARHSHHLDSMLSMTQAAFDAVRKISSSLRPGMLDTLGLVAAIKSHVLDFSSLTGIQVELHLTEHLNLPPERSIAVFRTVQEALTNVARHSGATRVRISLRKQQHQLFLEVEDNGAGLRQGILDKPDAFGILGMRERSEHMGGELNIHSAAGEGTILLLSMPLDAPPPDEKRFES